MGWSAVTTIATFLPAPISLLTLDVKRVCAATTYNLVSGAPAPSRYCTETCALTLPGLAIVRYSVKPGLVVPSAKYHVLAGAAVTTVTGTLKGESSACESLKAMVVVYVCGPSA